MKTDLDHLPPQKRRELERVVQLIFEEFEDAFALAKHDWKKAGRILKVILYGSYARGTWVDEPHTAKGYQSDFDLLIIVNDKRLTDRVKYWAKLDERLLLVQDDWSKWTDGSTREARSLCKPWTGELAIERTDQRW